MPDLFPYLLELMLRFWTCIYFFILSEILVDKPLLLRQLAMSAIKRKLGRLDLIALIEGICVGGASFDVLVLLLGAPGCSQLPCASAIFV